MNFRIRFGVLAATLSFLFLFLAPSANASGAKIKWGHNYDAAAAKANSSRKLILVDFYTGWCGWCKKLDSDVYTNPLVIGESKRFVCVKLDAEQNGLTLASTYSVHAYPTILVLDRDGCEVDRLEGYCPAPEFIHILRTFENEAAAYRALIEKVKAIPLNKAAAFRLIPMLFKHNKPDDVAALLDRLQKLGQTENMGTYYSELGDVYAKAHRQNELCDAYTKALNFTSDPDIELKAHLALANSYLASGDGINASSHLEWIVNAPNVPDKLKGEARSALSKIKGQ